MLAAKPAAARDDAPPADACAVGEGRQADGGGDETGFGGQPGGGDNSHSESGSGGEDGAVGEAPAHTWLDTGDSGQGQQAGLPGRDGGQGRGGGFAGQAGEGGACTPGEQAPHRVGAPPAGPASTPGLPVELVSSAVRARSTVRRTARPVETWAAGGVPPGRAAQAPAQPRVAPPDGGQHPPPPGQDTRLAAGAPDGGAATAGGVHPLRARPAKPPRDKRPRDITQEDLASCFHLPSEQACKALGIGLTVLKRQCRIFGIARWPFRKLASLDRLITNVESGVGLPPSTAASLDIKSVEQLQLQKAALEGLAITELDPATKKLQQAYSKATHRLRRQQQRKQGDGPDPARVSRPRASAAPGGAGAGGARQPATKAHRKQLLPSPEQPFGSSDSDASGSGEDEEGEDGDDGAADGKRPRRPNPKYMNPKPGGGAHRQHHPGSKAGHGHHGAGAFRAGVAGHDADLLASLAAAMEAVAGDGPDAEGDVEMEGEGDGGGSAGDMAPPPVPNAPAPEAAAGVRNWGGRGAAELRRARVVAAVEEHACHVDQHLLNVLGSEALGTLRPGLQLTYDVLRERLLREEVGDSS